MIQDRTGLAFVDFEPAANNFIAGVVETIFAQGAAAKALYHFIQIRADEVNDFHDVDGVVEELGLLDVSGDAVEDDKFTVGMELVDHLHALDVLLPEFDGDFVGDELSLAGVFPEYSAHFALEIERPEDVTGGAVIEAGDGTDDFALGSFSAAGGSEE